MQYALLIYNEPETVSTDEEIEGYSTFTIEVRQKGVCPAVEALQSTTTATTIRTSEGAKGTLADGPFAETREYLSGFYILECEDLDEAIEYGRRLNAIDDSTVEIRPVLKFN